MTLTWIYLILLICGCKTLNAFQIITKYNDYQPTWDSLDSRPLPDWYDEAKIGIFIHWGVFSVPAYGSEWFWYYWKGQKKQDYVQFMQKNHKPDFTYQDFAVEFTAEMFDPKQWAQLFKNSGAKYVVLTSKHHEGYTLWPSKYSYSWNAMDVGPHRDLVGELATAIRNITDLKFGLYHSFYEWFNPLYTNDKNSGWKQNDFVKSKTLPELYELVNTYKPEVIWSDGDGEASPEYWNSKEFLTWLYNKSPVRDTVVVNDRWGKDTACKHGGFYSCNDRYNPGVLVPHKWEDAMTLDKNSWGYRSNTVLSDFLTIKELIQELVKAVSCNGNILINVGPTKEGTIIPLFQERLLDLGSWLQTNGEAIYKSRPWSTQNDKITKDCWYTFRPDLNATYATFFTWPADQSLKLENNPKLFSTNTKVSLLNPQENKSLKWSVVSDEVIISLDNVHVQTQWAWIIKITQN